MAKIEQGTAGDRTISGVKGVQKATFSRVDDELVDGKEGRPDALRLRFHTDKDEVVSLGVPLGPVAKAKLTPFVQVPEGLPYSEEGLRHFINGAFNSGQVFYPECWNGWVTSIDPKNFDSMARVWCAPGQHRGYLRRAHKFVRQDGAPRVGFEFLSVDNRFASFTAPWPKDLLCEADNDDPANDYIGPASALNPGVTLWKYMILFGLQWDRFLLEMGNAPALYSFLADSEVEGYLGEADDISPALTQIVLRHGAQLVQWSMVITTQYGLGIERGTTRLPEFVPVITEGDEFARAVRSTLAAWDKLATIMEGKPTAICSTDGTITDEGRTIVGGLWRPVIDRYPAVTLAWDADKNRPAMKFPISATNWSLGGIVALGLMAERLAKMGGDELVNPAGLCATRKNTLIVPWVGLNVPEFSQIKTVKEEEV